MISTPTFTANVLRSFRSYLRRETYCRATPNILWIEPTNVCNLRCPMCPTTYLPVGERTGMMDFGLFRNIAREVGQFLPEVKLLQAGEPLLHPRIVDMVALLAEQGVATEIDTNATRMPRDLSRALIRAGLHLVTFSFDGYDKETYESIRRGGTYEKTIDNIRGFLEEKRRLATERPFVRIKSLVQRDERFTREKRRAFIGQFEGLPVDGFDLTPAWDWGNAEVSRDGTFDTGSGFKLAMDEGQRARYHPCQRLWTTMSIRWDGTAVPCCVDFYNDAPLGNVGSGSVLEVWNGPEMQALRRQHIDRLAHLSPLCSRCSMCLSPTVLGVPTYFYGPQTILKRLLGQGRYQKLNDRHRRTAANFLGV